MKLLASFLIGTELERTEKQTLIFIKAMMLGTAIILETQQIFHYMYFERISLSEDGASKEFPRYHDL